MSRKRVGLPAHLLGLVRLEQVELRRAQHLLARLVAPGLGDHPAFQRHLRRVHVVGVVGVVLAVAQHEGGLDAADHVDHLVLVVARQVERVVAQVEADEVMDAQRLGRRLGFRPARGLDPLERHAVLLPELGALAALAEGQAEHRHLVALRGVKRDRAAAAPDEIRRVRRYDQGGLCHRSPPPAALRRLWPSRRGGANPDRAYASETATRTGQSGSRSRGQIRSPGPSTASSAPALGSSATATSSEVPSQRRAKAQSPLGAPSGS